MTLYQTESSDGGLTWSAPRALFASSEIHLCEPGLIRSPDGRQLAVLLRENKRVKNAHLIVSNDEGRTWSDPRELPGALTGDRHTGKYAPDGRLFISFRDTTRESPTRGDWVGWVGTYDDIVHGREGQYRVRIMNNTKQADCAYPGVEVLPDGTLVTTTYGHWVKDEAPFVVSVRFKLGELDAKLPSARPPESSPSKPPRAARSVHLGYPGPDAEMFTAEMVIEKSVNGSYFMACGWDTGYFGLQQLRSPDDKVVIFSVWDPTKGDDPNAVGREDRVEVLMEGDGVRIKRFGGEGTGAQCMAPHDWRIGEPTRFLVRAETEAERTAYTAWVTRRDGDWWRLATFRTRTGGRLLRGSIRSSRISGATRKVWPRPGQAKFRNIWLKPPSSDWINVTRARFTASNADWESKENIDASVEGDAFRLATGGAIKARTALRSFLEVPQAGGTPPGAPNQ